MNPILVWLRTHPQERLALVGVALIGVFLVIGLFHGGGSTTGTSGTRAAPRPAQALPTTAPTVTPAPAVGSQPDQPALADATKVATSFLEAYASGRFDDTPDTVMRRLLPYVTSTLASTLSAGATSTGLSAARHEVAVGKVTKLVSQGYDVSGQLGFAAVIAQTVTGDAGQSTRTGSLDIYLVSGADGWRVNQIAVQHIQ